MSIATAAINTVFVPNQGLLVAYEKFSANAIIDIFINLIKLILIVTLLKYGSNRLRLYGIILFVTSLLSGWLYWYYCRKKHIEVVSFRFYKDKKLYKEMLSFSGWTMYGAVANVGRTQGSTILINYFFGTIVNAAYAIAGQIETFVMMFARSLGSAAVPQTTKSYSAGNKERSISLTASISKYTFILMGLLSFPLLLETEFLLELWLIDVPEGSSLFCKLIILGNLIGCLGEGIPNLINASGKVKWYQIVVHTVLILVLPISYVLYRCEYPPYTVCVVFCIVNFINSFIKLWMLKRVVNFDVLSFMKKSHFRIVLVSILMYILFYIYNNHIVFYIPDTFVSHIIVIFLSVVCYSAVVWFFGLETNERHLCLNYLYRSR